MPKTLDNLVQEKNSYDKESQTFIDSLTFERNELSEIGQMKQSSGWKLLDKKIREELHNRITELVAPDLKIQTLLSLLKVADTKSREKILQQEVANLLPEE